MENENHNYVKLSYKTFTLGKSKASNNMVLLNLSLIYTTDKECTTHIFNVLQLQ